jgi:TATA-box binding protein (TBP) (component of TFIID and TFIIIB)
MTNTIDKLQAFKPEEQIYNELDALKTNEIWRYTYEDKQFEVVFKDPKYEIKIWINGKIVEFKLCNVTTFKSAKDLKDCIVNVIEGLEDLDDDYDSIEVPKQNWFSKIRNRF